VGEQSAGGERVPRHVLVTNDFPPKTGGIQSYLWELWRRLDPSSFAVLTTMSHPDFAAFDARQAELGFRIERVSSRFLLPTAYTARRVSELARAIGASFVVLDPVLPAGLLGRHLHLPYAVVLHGAEVTVPGRLPVSGQLMTKVLDHARLVICAGEYPADEARRRIRRGGADVVEIPPGVDTARFTPIDAVARAATRSRFGLPEKGPLLLSVSRLVPRKGMDVVVEASAALTASFPDLVLAISGAGRDLGRLERLAEATRAPVRFLGPVPDDLLPALYGAADVFVMACRNRWGGLEQEGFGIVFLEAAAAGVVQVAGRSGGAAEAVEDGVTGLVVDEPHDPSRVAGALRRLLSDEGLRQRMGRAARLRARRHFEYDLLSHMLADALGRVEG